MTNHVQKQNLIFFAVFFELQSVKERLHFWRSWTKTRYLPQWIFLFSLVNIKSNIPVKHTWCGPGRCVSIKVCNAILFLLQPTPLNVHIECHMQLYKHFWSLRCFYAFIEKFATLFFLLPFLFFFISLRFHSWNSCVSIIRNAFAIQSIGDYWKKNPQLVNYKMPDCWQFTNLD